MLESAAMATLYTWLPTVGHGHPDFGHSALEIPATRGACYVSFWPEPNTLLGAITHYLRPAPSRCPDSYDEEVAADGPFMRRAADERDDVDGLDNDAMAAAWASLNGSHFSVRRWNCSDVAKFLIIHGMESRYYQAMEAALDLTSGQMEKISRFQREPDLLAELEELKFIDTRPEEVAQIVRIYRRYRAEDSSRSAG